MPPLLEAPVELDAQYRSLREGAGLFERPGRALLELHGGEGAEFLDGQLTNEIESLQAGEGRYAALLDRKGKMQADMRVLRIAADLLWLETPAACAAEVERHLNTYKIGRDVQLESVATVVLGLAGPASGRALGDLPLGVEHTHRVERLGGREVRVVATESGADLLVGPGDAETVATALLEAGADPVGFEAAEILRVESGRPAFGAEMGNDTIPQEAGINDRAVSFEKGCYIGQETVARLHYRGKPNRHLRRLRPEAPVESGAPVKMGDRELGRIGTAVISPAEGPLALAILRREAEPGAEVTVGGAVSATVEEAGA